MANWKTKVYGQAGRERGRIANWLKWREIITVRDGLRCQVCNKFYGNDRSMLQVHHIIPRSEGGRTINRNLISLCVTCHDAVEIDPDVLTHAIAMKQSKRVSKNKKLDWHEWVYGGAKKPQ
jgi:5-methylcytosine-specific restriction endonuclease McrA